MIERKSVLIAVAVLISACTGNIGCAADAEDSGDRRLLVDAGGLGPTGQWPAGFPAYSTAADIVTNGTSGSLSSAISSMTCSSGCVIEHAGNVSGSFSSRNGTGEIVVRPPIGQRAEFTISATILVDNLLFAGYGGGEASLQVGSASVGDGAVNSGYAWIESDASNGHGYFAVNCNGGSVSDGLFYEIVFKRYADISQDYDRGGLRGGWPPGSGGTCDAKIVGSWIAGVTCPDGSDHPQGLDCHSDTFQEYVPDGTCLVEINDSVMWGSEDKVLQGSSLPPCGPHEINNSIFIAPDYALSVWTGPSFSWYGSGPQPFHTTADAIFTNSTLIGPIHPDVNVTYQNSELYRVSGGRDLGGNTTMESLPGVPRAPTHSELDAIWSP